MTENRGTNRDGQDSDSAAAGRPDPLAGVREHDDVLAAIAARGDALGATATCLRRWAGGEDPPMLTASRSHFDVGGAGGAFGQMGPAPSVDPPDDLAAYADEFADEAAAADDPAARDACAILAALLAGEAPPRDAVRREADRAEKGNDG